MNNILFFSNNTDRDDIDFFSDLFLHLRNLGYRVLSTSCSDISNCENIELLIRAKLRSQLSEPNELKSEIASAVKKGCQIYKVDFNQSWYSRYCSAISWLFDVSTPTGVVVWNNHAPENSLAISLAQQRGLPIAVLERTPWPGIISIDCDGFNVDSRFYKEIQALSDHNLYLENLDRDVGFVDRSVRAVLQGALTWWPLSEGKAGRPNSQSKCSTNILFLEQLDWDAATQLWGGAYKNSRDALKAVSDATFGLERAKVVLRPHPKSGGNINQYAEQLENVAVSKNPSLKADILSADVVVAINSSALYEAVLHCKPAISLGRTLLDGKGIFFSASNEELRETLLLVASENISKSDLSERRAKMIELVKYLSGRGYLLPSRRTIDGEGARNAAKRIAEIIPSNTSRIPPSRRARLFFYFALAKALNRLRLLRRLLSKINAGEIRRKLRIIE